jgi:hypothetical protein
MMTRLPEEMRDARVGHADVAEGVVVKDGTYANVSRPAEAKSAPQTVISMPSELVNRIVRTGLAIAS